MTTETPVEQLMRSPKLPLYVRQLQALWQEERCKREQFYRDVSEGQKAEFINGEIIMGFEAQWNGKPG